ncbi:MAG: TonB-dependent receptor, partial [Bacteroidetes bacterium]|nr:TonB-dependent receptor [Bacteroidota bacterium]
PVLDQPIRATLRSNLNHGQTALLELYASYIWNYVYLTDRSVNAVKYTTYKNIDAILLGFNVSTDWDYLELAVSYTWGQNLDAHSPLAEIVPVRLEGTLESPEFSGLSALLRATYQARQGRVDTELNESATDLWYRIDLAVNYQLASVRFLFEVENLTNQLFTQHLSYMRNPFTSGNRIIEPGRTFRLSIRYFGEF